MSGSPVDDTPTVDPARPMLCSDAEGRELVITIRLSPDGRVYLHDIPPGFVPVAAALAPNDPALAERAAILERKAMKP